MAAKTKRPRPPSEIPDVDTTSTASIYWDARLTPTDKTQHSVLAESQKSDNTGMWHHKKTDITNSKSNSNTLFRNHTEGSWLSSPHSSCPHLLHDTTDGRVLDQADKDNKAETATSYRLFGIDLIDHSKNSAALGKGSSHVANITGVTAEVSSSTLSSIDTGRKSDISKAASMEKKQDLQLVSPKETQSKQICSRSRTK
ncbi:auxin response factor 9-like, partial [Trifolium medium]|nr:auxin response factor 9-like [Trifolium medium]